MEANEILESTWHARSWRFLAKRANFSFLVTAIILAYVFAAHGQTSPPPTYDVKMKHIWIPMKDGVRLAANLLMPVGAKPGEKFPAIFKYDPYRKDDNDTVECELVKYFVARGYVGACIDIRGTGRSEEHVPDMEYSEQELSDGEEVIAWPASQPWSSGSVGIYGKSYSGFNGIELAMRNPTALKAIITVDSTDKLYEGDCIYSDGVMNMGDGYNFGIDAHNAFSPSPNFPIDEKTLNNRFDNPPWSRVWMKHQHDDAFWHDPVKSPGSIRIPVFLIGGFLDE